MENILEEYFGAISQIFVYLPLTCYEILRLLVFWHFPNDFRSVGKLIQILLSLGSIFLSLVEKHDLKDFSGIMPQSWTLGNIGQPKCCFGFIFCLEQRFNEEGGSL